ncbi:MAG: ferrochelatase [Gammaproteobacteria bacterium]|jgi:ferrochelatase
MQVKAKSLKYLAGCVWLAVGIGLLIAGLRFVFGLNEEGSERTPGGIALALSIGGAIGFLKGRYVLSRTAQRNLKRIKKLRDPRVWHVFTRTMAILILLMIALGRGLRGLAADGYLGGYLGIGGLYVGIGMALAVASLTYFLPGPQPLPTRIDGLPGGRPAKRGLLLVNLGSPQAPTRPAVRAFLKQFLGDPRVVEANRALWAFVLNVIILPFRSGKSAKLYQGIWTDAGSPLIVYAKALTRAVTARLGSRYEVALGMRYGEPSLDSALKELRNAGCGSVLVLPLFPQYSNTTTGSILDEVVRVTLLDRDPMELSFVPAFYDDPDYIDALGAVAEKHPKGDFTVFSFHGIPEAYVSAGDPYLQHCGRTAWMLAERLGLARDEWEMVFQSQFGSEPWLQPYLDEFVPDLAQKYKCVRVIAPSFTADCLETIEEIGMELREDFVEAGGEELIVVPALNSDEVWVAAIDKLLQRVDKTTPAQRTEAESSCGNIA